MKSLIARAAGGLLVTVACSGLCIFVPAGTIDYWQGWAYLGLFFVISVLITAYLAVRDPALLQRRLSAGPSAEKEMAQKIIMLLASLGFVAILGVAGLDRRFHWSPVPLLGVIAGDILVILGFYLVFVVYRENTYTSATIEIAKDQKVISTGPYSVVRHPMYAGGLVFLLGMPLALGSYWSIAAFATIVPVIVWRLLHEEQFLSRNLPGYEEYRTKVRYRLIPGVF